MRTSVGEIKAVRVLSTRKGFTTHLSDGRAIFTPWSRHWRLADAVPSARKHVMIGCRGSTLRWPDIDEDLLVADLGRTDVGPAPRPKCVSFEAAVVSTFKDYDTVLKRLASR
jgi:hypothetical protein